MHTRHLLGALSLIGTTGLHAQSAPLAATAVVVTPIVVSGTQALDFGNVLQGVNKNVNFNNTNSGRFAVTGLGNAQVSFTLTLPTTLVSGASTMPITNYGVRVNDVSSSAGASQVAVTSGVPFMRNLVSGVLYFFIGGRVTPSATQAAGSYSGSITLAAAYTGL
ncbi:MAG: DUF4402 domain-containing protein [Gemmatimonadota bacterium]